jgi:hypothetical protein
VPHNLAVPTIYQEQHNLQQPTNALNLDLENKDHKVHSFNDVQNAYDKHIH